MIVYTMNADTKGAVVAALAAHGTDRLAMVGLGRVARDDSALATGAIVGAWPADADGLYRIALTATAALILWRAFMCAEIAAGRGKRRDIGRYCDALGVEVYTAYEYVVAALKGTGMRPLAGVGWSDNTMWVACDGEGIADPRKRWARSAWRGRAKAHETLAQVGLAVRGQPTWQPRATCLFAAPLSVTPAPVLAPADEEALTWLAA
jgi:hypothetical protein